MASNAVYAAFNASEEIPILHYYGAEVFTMAKRILISALLLKGDKVDVEEFLKDTFPRKQQIILAAYHGGSAFSLNDVSYSSRPTNLRQLLALIMRTSTILID